MNCLPTQKSNHGRHSDALTNVRFAHAVAQMYNNSKCHRSFVLVWRWNQWRLLGPYWNAAIVTKMYRFVYFVGTFRLVYIEMKCSDCEWKTNVGKQTRKSNDSMKCSTLRRIKQLLHFSNHSKNWQFKFGWRDASFKKLWIIIILKLIWNQSAKWWTFFCWFCFYLLLFVGLIKAKYFVVSTIF